MVALVMICRSLLFLSIVIASFFLFDNSLLTQLLCPICISIFSFLHPQNPSCIIFYSTNIFIFDLVVILFSFLVARFWWTFLVLIYHISLTHIFSLSSLFASFDASLFTFSWTYFGYSALAILLEWFFLGLTPSHVLLFFHYSCFVSLPQTFLVFFSSGLLFFLWCSFPFCSTS